MPARRARAHRVGKWASLCNTSSEIAETIFEATHYNEKLVEQIWKRGSDKVLTLTFAKTDKDALLWGEQTIEREDAQDVYFRQVSS